MCIRDRCLFQPRLLAQPMIAPGAVALMDPKNIVLVQKAVLSNIKMTGHSGSWLLTDMTTPTNLGKASLSRLDLSNFDQDLLSQVAAAMLTSGEQG